LGYEYLYTDLDNDDPASKLMEATTDARGGTQELPDPYPAGAWFTNPDATCGHVCNGPVYLWLGLVAVGGAYEDPGRCSDLHDQWGWPYCTRDELEALPDLKLLALVEDSQYQLPSCFPNGIYGDEPTNCYAMASCAAGFALLAAFILNV